MKALMLVVALVAASAGLYGQASSTHAHVIAQPGEAQWGPAPPLLPPGAQIAVLAGDPAKPVPYAIRLKFPAHYAIPAHSHPTDEHVVVTAGALSFGMATSSRKRRATKRLASAASRSCRPT
jgi:hypothetical protein